MHTLCRLGPSQAPLEMDRDWSQPQTIPRLSKVSQPVKRPQNSSVLAPRAGDGSPPWPSRGLICAIAQSPGTASGSRSRRVWAGPGRRQRTQGTESRSRSWRPALNPVPQPAGWRLGGPAAPSGGSGHGHWPPSPGSGGGAGPGVGLLRPGGCGVGGGGGGRSSWPRRGGGGGPRAEGRPPPSSPGTGPFLGLKEETITVFASQLQQQTVVKGHCVSGAVGLERACKMAWAGFCPNLTL